MRAEPREPRRTDAGDGKAQQKRKGRNDPRGIHFRRHVADGLHDALQNADVLLADGDQQRERRTDIEESGQDAAPGDGSRQNALRILNFVAHDRREFETDETETDDAEGIEDEARVCWNLEVRGGDRGSEAKPDDDAQADQDRGGDSGADRAEIVDPFSYAKSDHVEYHEDGEKDQRSAQGENLVVGERLVPGAEREDEYTDEIQHDGRNVHHVVGPVAPAGKEAVKIAEDFFGPEVDATFAGVAMRQFDHGDALRPEEKNQGDDPQPDGYAAIGGDGRDNVEIEDRDDEEKDEVPAAQDAA